METLIIKDQTIPYEERRSVRYRRITLSILEDRVRISAPINVSAKQLRDLLRVKQEWILKHWLAKLEKQKPSVRYIDGEQFLYLGKAVELKIIRYRLKRIQVFLEGQVLVVNLPQDLPDQDYELNVKTALKTWYKVQARKVLQEKLDKQAKKMQVIYHAFRLKEQKTSWGSCSSKGNLNLNWRIIMAPDPAIDYIIIHELAHLTFLNHSKQFWQKVAEFMPDYAEWKKWFKDYGHELTI